MRRTVIIKAFFILITVSLPLSLFAQKEVRKNIRKGNKQYEQQKFSDAADLYGKAVEENPESKECGLHVKG